MNETYFIDDLVEEIRDKLVKLAETLKNNSWNRDLEYWANEVMSCKIIRLPFVT